MYDVLSLSTTLFQNGGQDMTQLSSDALRELLTQADTIGAELDKARLKELECRTALMIAENDVICLVRKEKMAKEHIMAEKTLIKATQ